MSISLLWRWMDWIVRGDVILLGLMLVSVIGIAIHVAYRLSRRERDLTDRRVRRQLAADLGVEVAVVRSIVVVAPYLGLVGACFGALCAFNGIGIEAESGFLAVAPRVAICFVTTSTGTLVAIAATCVSRYLISRVESFRSRRSAEEAAAGEYSHLASKFPLRKRVSGLPAYALIAAPTFACLAAAYSPYVDPQLATGFAVDLAPIRCEVGEGRIVLHITDGGELFLNESEKLGWGTLRDRVAEFYHVRADRTIYLVADSGLSYQRVIEAIDLVESAEMPDQERIRVRLVTPKAEGGCPYRVLRRVLLTK